MISFINNKDTQSDVTEAIRRLTRAITLSQGQFSLLLVCCNSVNKQQQLLNLLEEFLSVDITQIQLPSSAETLYTAIINKLGSNQPQVLMIQGLESVVGINQLITSTNMMRNELSKKFRFPLVLWVNDEVLRKLIWLAPDLKDWAATTIKI